MAIGFPMRRSHQLIATPIAPLAAPVCRPRLVVSLGSPCVCSFLVLSLRSVHLVIPSSRLILLSFLSSSRRCLPHSWRRIGSWGRQLGWRRDFLYAPFSSADYRSPRHQVLIIGGGRRPIVVGSTGRSRRCPLIISSGSSHSSPLPHLITERRRWCLSYFKQATTTWRSLGSSSHPIISSHPRHGASCPPFRLMASRRASRPHIPGHQRGRGGRSKQANTQNRDEKPGSRSGRRTKRERKYNGDGTMAAQERQASKQGQRRHTTQSWGKNKTPLILFRPTPSPSALIGSPASISPPPPGRGMRGRR